MEKIGKGWDVFLILETAHRKTPNDFSIITDCFLYHCVTFLEKNILMWHSSESLNRKPITDLLSIKGIPKSENLKIFQ